MYNEAEVVTTCPTSLCFQKILSDLFEILNYVAQ